MDIEDYAAKHRHYWNDSFNNGELEFLLKSRRHKRLIDIGCGDGIFLHNLNHIGFLKNIEEIWAVDLSVARLNNVKAISNNIKTLQTDAQHLKGVPDNYFDFVVCTQVIEHVENDFEMIKSIYRITQPGAIVYLDTVYKQMHGYYFYKNKKGKHVLDPTHEREYTNTLDLVMKIKFANFDIIQSVMTPIKFCPINFVFRLLNINNKQILQNFALRVLQRFRVRIIGYKCWKLILWKSP